MEEVFFFVVPMKDFREVFEILKDGRPNGRITRQSLVKEGHCHGVRNWN